MNLMFTTSLACPVCGYHNRGVMSATAQPRMHDLRITRMFGSPWPARCTECDHPLASDRISRMRMDPPDAERVRAWRERQRRRHATRKRSAA